MNTHRPKTHKPERRKTTGEAASRHPTAGLQKQLYRRTRELAKTRKLLKEALQQQSATSEVLQVINSSAVELASVFDAMLKRAMRLCEAAFGGLWVFESDRYVVQALCGVPPAYASYLRHMNLLPGPHTAPYRFLQGERSAIQNVDLAAEEPYLTGDPQRRALVDLGGARAALQVPLVRDELVLGVITVYRQEVRPFSAQQVTLLQNFADQAVIAIENARLFDEVQAKTRDLSEALTYQTGSANILRVIASSPTDVEPVLNAIVQSACELCDAHDAFVRLKNGDNLEFGAHYGPIPVTQDSVPISRGWTAGLAVIERRSVHVHDLLSPEGDKFPEARELGRAENHRTILSVPLMREGDGIGAIVLRRAEVHPFSDKQIALLQTFADQAVIAIGNVRLFEQVQQKTRDLSELLRQQTATADVLKVISRSAFNLDHILDALTESVAKLCDADQAFIFRRSDNLYRLASNYGNSPEFEEYARQHPIAPEMGTITGRTALKGIVVHIPDVLTDDGHTASGYQASGKYRSGLGVPLLRNGQTIGVFTLTRRQVRPFSDKQIDLVMTFADQAVIAIENARLLNELRNRTQELSQSLDDLRAAQDRLVQTEKLASLGQLTAGIAHEIKNPLNFVNNFSALSAELTDELNEVLKSAALSGKMREEVDELTGLLKDNLKKVVQHGKRADSIVKNMLLHSREGSGEHRPADINSLLDESLNLAYHGARAEKGEFNITLEREFDAQAGTVELFPQEITRAFLNLISNGAYAASKRKTEDKEPGFEPTLRAATKDLGSTVEIRIRDNGKGIPAGVREKMFNPFFTTKPAGEGTGLGLSMTHDIIVKQHGGRIDVATEPGQFTEFTIVLPRKSTASTGN